TTRTRKTTPSATTKQICQSTPPPLGTGRPDALLIGRPSVGRRWPTRPASHLRANGCDHYLLSRIVGGDFWTWASSSVLNSSSVVPESLPKASTMITRL